MSNNKRWRFVFLNFLVICSLLLTPGLVLADEPDQQPDAPGTATGVKPTADDGSLEFGVWWAEDYPPAGAGGSDLPATRPDALGLRNQLTSTCRFRLFGICIWNWPTPSWTARYVFGNSSAWEQDWKRAAAGGTENSYVDRVDLAYWAGHGSSSGILFGVGGNTHDDAWLTYNDAAGAWGDGDLDWVALAACNVLDDAHLGDWANTMNGLRLIMGFKTTMADVPHGEWFGQYIREGYSMGQAWFKAADKLQPQNKIARVLAEESWMYNDKWYNHASTDYLDNQYWYWTHRVGSEPARFVDASDITEMPVYAVQPLGLAEANSRWDALGSATGVTTTDFITVTTIASLSPTRSALEVGNIRTSQNGELEMDENAGLFAYNNLGELWVAPGAESANTEAVQSISATDAITIAEKFLKDNGFLPADAQYFEVAADTLTQATDAGNARSAQGMQIVSEQTMVNQVIYSRIVTGTVTSKSRGVAETVEFSVMGPGSKLKVYVDTAVPAGLSAAALSQEAVIGALGGYRSVQQPAVRGTNKLLTIPILPAATMAKILDLNAQKQQELESMFSLSYVPLGNIDSRTITSSTLAYWEGPMGASQDQLIPVHAIDVRNVLTDSTVVSYTAYIPANPTFMPPLAKIESATTGTGSQIPAEVSVGMTLTLSAVDATKTLAAAGYDAALDFVAGSGDYLYNWYVDEVSAETKVGVGRTATFAVAIPGEDVKADNRAVQQTLILEVVDSNSNREPNKSYSRMTINVIPPLFLPNVIR
ncbi:MAG: DUF6345 domain-containing protein [Caldilineaceae bacterium]